MPPKAKKKRASLKLDAMSGQVEESESTEEKEEDVKEPTVRQVVEVVEDSTVSEAMDTIKKDAEEIEEAVETIEEEVQEERSVANTSQSTSTPSTREEVAGDSQKSVESIFEKSNTGVHPEITVVGKRGPSLGVWVGAMLGVALAIGVSLVLLIRGPSTLPFMAAQPTPTPEPTAIPTPSPATVSRIDIKVRVTNGGGTPGAGSKMKTFLEGKGYTVASVANADAYTYTQTEISVKSDKAAYKSLLTDDLKADYSLGTASAVITESAPYDAEVIVGKEE
ncbi:MAG: LytR C-terminal domain-containing protein [Patescibacteria group bacterium]